MISKRLLVLTTSARCCMCTGPSCFIRSNRHSALAAHLTTSAPRPWTLASPPVSASSLPRPYILRIRGRTRCACVIAPARSKLTCAHTRALTAACRMSNCMPKCISCSDQMLHACMAPVVRHMHRQPAGPTLSCPNSRLRPSAWPGEGPVMQHSMHAWLPRA